MTAPTSTGVSEWGDGTVTERLYGRAELAADAAEHNGERDAATGGEAQARLNDGQVIGARGHSRPGRCAGDLRHAPVLSPGKDRVTCLSCGSALPGRQRLAGSRAATGIRASIAQFVAAAEMN